MTLQASQPVSRTGTTPTALVPAATDTIAEGSFGVYGVVARVITTGTTTDFGVTDPGVTQLGYAGTVVPVTMPATGVRMVFVPRAAINQATGLATVTFSGARTGVTYELYPV